MVGDIHIPMVPNPPRCIWSAAVNGDEREVLIHQNAILLDVLRDDLGMLGVKRGCDMGTCGCCTVHIDGSPRLSCMTLAGEVEGRSITTVEGLSNGPHLHPIQTCFATHGGSQCGFCTPGFLMSASALLERNPDPSPEEVADAIEGNLCRCTGYQQIVESILEAAKLVQDGHRTAPTSDAHSDPHPAGPADPSLPPGHAR